MESAIDGKGSELLAILYAHKTFKSLIQGKAVKLYTDSKNASAISQIGSTTLALQQQALEMFQFCGVNYVSVEIEWDPRWVGPIPWARWLNLTIGMFQNFSNTFLSFLIGHCTGW